MCVCDAIGMLIQGIFSALPNFENNSIKNICYFAARGEFYILSNRNILELTTYCMGRVERNSHFLVQPTLAPESNGLPMCISNACSSKVCGVCSLQNQHCFELLNQPF